MRNTEVLDLVEKVNDVLLGNEFTDDHLETISKWTKMGVEESGHTAYRVADRLITELRVQADHRNEWGAATAVESTEKLNTLAPTHAYV